MKNKRISRIVKIGGFGNINTVYLGGDSPVAVQTMHKDALSYADLENDILIKKIENLGKIGCDMLRFAVPNIESAEILGRLAQAVKMPLVADIHFDYKISLRCLDFPIAKIRINPGNIGGKEKIAAVLEKAGKNNVPIRIGVNAGSLPSDIKKRVEEGLDNAQALVLAAERELEIFKEFGFLNYVVSMKAAGIADTIRANNILCSRTDAPLHLGVTEAGPLAAGIVFNTAALVPLLKDGVGDTIRVSLSDTMVNEIIAAKHIIKAAADLSIDDNARLKKSGVRIISCPRCGRHGFDTHGFTMRWQPKLYSMDRELTIAIMGCEVNGPQEAKNADLGITGAGDKVLIFKKGKIIKTIACTDADIVFEEELHNL